MQISILVVRALVQELRQRGLPADELCVRAGIERAALEDPTARVHSVELGALLDQVAERAPSHHLLALEVGANTPIAALTVLGHLLTSCETLRDASALFATYSPLVAEGVKWELREKNGVATQSFALAPELLRLRDFGADLAMALTFRVMRGYVGNAKLLEVWFEREQAADAEAYEAFFEAPVRFGAPANAMRFPAELLDRRQLHADVGLREILRRRADSMLAGLSAPERLPARIRDYLLTHEQPNAVRICEVAGTLGIPERTLRRRLSESGVGFRELFEATLRDIAVSALSDSGVGVKNVAARLGFADVSTFHRAFKRWTGVTPAEYRARASA